MSRVKKTATKTPPPKKLTEKEGAKSQLSNIAKQVILKSEEYTNTFRERRKNNKAEFNSFKDFYPFYIDEHKNKYTKLLHFIGTWLFIVFILLLIITGEGKYIFYAFLSAYSWAWFGHFFIEKNKPATFKYPFYSLIGDWKMFREILQGKHRIF